MVWTFHLVNGASSLNINDGTNFHVNVNGFSAPPPQRITSYTGNTFFRSGADLLARSYANRQVTLNLSIRGTGASQLGSLVGTVWDMLRKAEEWSKDGLGTQVQLRYQWEGATGTYLFNVIEGVLDLGQDLHSAYLLKGTRAQHAVLQLECEPFVTQPGETAMNWVKDPSFEIAATPLTDWPVTTGDIGNTGTRRVGTAKWGTAHLALIKASAGGFNDMQVQQNISTTSFASGSKLSVGVWYQQTITDAGRAALYINLLNSGGTQVDSYNVQGALSTNVATWTLMSITNIAVTGSLGTLQVQLVGRGFAGAGTGTFLFDNAILSQGSSLPTAWVSGRDVANHFDDNGQAHINYLDIYNVPGDVPAPAQIKVLENEAHTDVWVGARHDTRLGSTLILIEGESFTSTIGAGWTGTAAASDSSGSRGNYAGVTTTFPSSTATTASAPQVVMFNIVTPPVGQFRVITRAGARTINTASGTAFFGVGYQYGSVTKDPSTTAQFQKVSNTATSGEAYDMLDLGIVSIPPFKAPSSSTIGTYGLRIAHYVSSATNISPLLDYVMLMPVDAGGGYVSKTGAVDNLWVDSASRPEGIYRVSTADVVQSFPANQVGSPPQAHPKGSRLYFLFDDATSTGSIGHGAVVSVSYIPRFLQVGT